MRTADLTCDAAGRVEHAGEGLAFALVPRAASLPGVERPGRYPVRLRTHDGDEVDVVGPHVYDFGRAVAFHIVDGGARACWHLITFTRPREGVQLTAAPRIATLLAHDETTDPAPPDGSTAGVPLPHTARRVAVTFSGLSLVFLSWLDAAGSWATATSHDISTAGALWVSDVPPGARALHVTDPADKGVTFTVAISETY